MSLERAVFLLSTEMNMPLEFGGHVLFGEDTRAALVYATQSSPIPPRHVVLQAPHLSRGRSPSPPHRYMAVEYTFFGAIAVMTTPEGELRSCSYKGYYPRPDKEGNQVLHAVHLDIDTIVISGKGGKRIELARYDINPIPFLGLPPPVNVGAAPSRVARYVSQLLLEKKARDTAYSG